MFKKEVRMFIVLWLGIGLVSLLEGGWLTGWFVKNGDYHAEAAKTGLVHTQQQTTQEARSDPQSELRTRFGNPYSERFLVPPDISLAIAYTSDGTPCQMLIEPPRPLLAVKNEGDKYMAGESVSKLISELVPVSERGIYLMMSDEQMGCAHNTVTKYEKVTISRADNACVAAPERDTHTSVTFVKRSCKIAK